MIVADLAALVASIPNPALVVGDDGLIVVANDLAATLVGSGIEGRRIESLIPERARSRHARARQTFTGSEGSRPMGLGRELIVLGEGGQQIPAEIALSRIETALGPMTLAILVDARDRHARLAVLEARARTDPLTGLANRAAAEEELGRRMRARAPFCVLAADLDGLRTINNRLGHAGGDALLRAFARRLRATVREEDLVARIGGDEFLLAVGAATRDVIRVATRVTGAGVSPIDVLGERVALTASVGVAERRTGDTRTSVCARADAALFAAKAAGRCAVAVMVEGQETPVVVTDLPAPDEPTAR